jgi:hypothetical protein
MKISALSVWCIGLFRMRSATENGGKDDMYVET